MKLLPEGKSKALSAGALAAAGACAFMTVKAALALLPILELSVSPAFELSMLRATVPVDMPPLARFMVDHVRIYFSFFLFFWLSGFILSLGLWARREWARRGTCWMLYLLSGAALLVLFYPWLVVPKPFMYGDVSLAPEFNAVVKTAAYLARLASFLGGGGCLWGALLLDRGRLKGEFV